MLRNAEVYMKAAWKLVSLGDRKYQLEMLSGHVFGWIHGHVIRLLGLRDVNEALMSAPVLRRSLDDMLAREYPSRYQPIRDFADLRLVHDGAYEWIAAENVPIARVHRPPSGKSADGLGVEFVLPSYASERVTIACAAILADTLHERILSSVFTEEGRESTGPTVVVRSRRNDRARDIPA